jgi:hypothetical protein
MEVASIFSIRVFTQNRNSVYTALRTKRISAVVQLKNKVGTANIVIPASQMIFFSKHTQNVV